ncbi:20685_t:CDS:2, partial [Gigaspora rosea]
PNAFYIYNKLSKWYKVVNRNASKDKNELAIFKAFQSADTIIPTLSADFPTCPKDKLTSSSKLDFSISDDYYSNFSR